MSEPQIDPPHLDILGIAICLFFSGLFSGTETVLISLSESRTRDLINDPKRWGTKRLEHWLRRSTRILASLLVGNNVVNIAGSILAAKVAYFYLQSYAEAAAIGVMTLLVLIFGEVIPKSIGKRWHWKLAPWAMLLALIADRLLFPISWPLGRIARRLMASIESKSGFMDQPAVTEGEIQHMIELGEEEGVIDKQEGELMRSVMEFDETIAKEVMIPRGKIIAIPMDAGINKAFDIAISSGHSRIPAFRDKLDNIEGLLYTKDLLSLRRKGAPDTIAIKDLVRESVIFVPETKKISDLLKEMQKQRFHLAIVVDEFGSIAGLITIEDIIEELVGEIRDEHDKEETPISKTGELTWEAFAWVSIYELGESLEIEIPDTGEYETLGGFLTDRHGSVPAAGREIRWNHFKFIISDADIKRVIKVKIIKTGTPSKKPE